MALPHTPAEADEMIAEWRRTFPMDELLRMIYGRLFPQRPHTDDMVQMLFDLGIELPDRPRPRFEELAFEWRSP